MRGSVEGERLSAIPGVSRLEQVRLSTITELVRAAVERVDVLVIAGDTGAETAEAVSVVCSAVLDAGVRYVCCWGPGCERLHALFDEAHVAREIAFNRELELMTTGHSAESLADALAFGVRTAWPPTQVDDRRVLVVTLGDAVSAEASALLARGAPLLDRA